MIVSISLFKVVKPIVETDISRAASSFAKDSTLIKYRWVENKWMKETHELRLGKTQIPDDSPLYIVSEQVFGDLTSSPSLS